MVDGCCTLAVLIQRIHVKEKPNRAENKQTRTNKSYCLIVVAIYHHKMLTFII